MFELETCLAPQASVTISQKGLIAPCCQFNLWPEDKWFSIYDLDSLHEAHGTDRWNKYDSEPSGYDGSSKCRTCIREEESGAYSLRQTWNEKIKKEDKHIEHLEISLDFTCNMMCRSCGPSQSSKWNGSSVLEELQILNMPDNEGMYTAIKNPRNYQDNIKRVLNNTDLSHLKEVTIVGGEPLYSKSLPWFLSLLHEDVKLIVVTNGSLMPSDDMFSKFKSVMFQVSVDAIGDLGTAMRMKVPFETVDKNIKQMIKKYSVQLHTTISVQNINRLAELDKYCMNDLQDKVKWSHALLHEPAYMRIDIIPLEKRMQWLTESEWINDSMKMPYRESISDVQHFLENMEILDDESTIKFKDANPEIMDILNEM
jgi:MoaA/NifB/PqqE/SkfB family radical SAM enzyme